LGEAKAIHEERHRNALLDPAATSAGRGQFFWVGLAAQRYREIYVVQPDPVQ